MTRAPTWRTIDGFESYEVSDTGIVRRRFASHFTAAGFVLKQKTTPKGYKKVCLSKPGTQKWVLVHRLVCSAFNGPPLPGKPHVGHNDGNPANNAASNLRWVNPAENSADMQRHGTVNRSEKHPMSKLKLEDIEAIRAQPYFRRVTLELAREYGVSHTTISRIRTGVLWATSL